MGKTKDYRVNFIYKSLETTEQLAADPLTGNILIHLAQNIIRSHQGSQLPVQLQYYHPKDGSLCTVSQEFSLCLHQIFMLMKGIVWIKIQTTQELVLQLQQQLCSLQEEVQLLKEQVLLLKREMSVQKSQKPLTLKHRKTSYCQKSLDIGILFSDPLVEYKNKAGQIAPPKPLLEPVSYRAEIERLRALYSAAPVSIKCQVATLQNLLHMIQRGVQILHIICHGLWVPQENGYCLAFQSFQNIGAKINLTSQNLKEIYNKRKDQRTSLKLVFINSCHSQPVAEVVLKITGAEYAIAVQSRQKIQDTTAYVFSYNFYKNLLLNFMPIEDAFQSAKNLTRIEMGVKKSVCCCGHQHHPGCLFHQQMIEYGERKAHELFHIPPKSSCKNCKPNDNWHKSNCGWAIDTLKRINKDYQGKQPEDFAHLQKINLCCCCENLKFYEKHDQTQKFMLIKNNEVKGSSLALNKDAPFEDETGPQLNYWYCKQQTISIVGRNLQLERIAKSLKGVPRLVIITGPPGSGKSLLARRACQYVVERGWFAHNLMAFDFSMCESGIAFKFKLTESFQNFDLNKLIEYLKEKSQLFVLQNLDLFLTKDYEEAVSALRHLITSLPKSKFVLTLNLRTFNTLTAFHLKDVLGVPDFVINLDPLIKIMSARLLLSHAKDHIQTKYHDPKILAKHDIFNLIQNQPKTIIDLVNFISCKGQCLGIDKLYSKMLPEVTLKNQKNLQINAFLIKNLEYLQVNHPEAHTLLIMLAQFPSGLSIGDLTILGDSQYGFIPQDWKTCLYKLLNFNQEKGQELKGAISIKAIEQVKSGIYYFIQKQDRGQERFYSVTSLVRQHFHEHKTAEIKAKEEQAMLFVSFYLRYLLSQYRDCRQYHQGFLEESNFSECGFWGIKMGLPFFRQIFIRYQNQKTVEFSKRMSDSVTKWRKVEEVVKHNEKKYNISHQKQFIRHKQNFSSFRDIFYNAELFRHDKYLEAAENLVLTIPTLCKLTGRIILAQNSASDGLQFLKKVIQQEERRRQQVNLSLVVSVVKLNLFQLQVRIRKSLTERKFIECLKEIDICFVQNQKFLLKEKRFPFLVLALQQEAFYLRSFVCYLAIKRTNFNKAKEADILETLKQSSKGFRERVERMKELTSSSSLPQNIRFLQCKFQILKFKIGTLDIARRDPSLAAAFKIDEQLFIESFNLLGQHHLHFMKLESILTITKFRLKQRPPQPDYRLLKNQLKTARQIFNTCSLGANYKLQNELTYFQNEVDSKILEIVNNVVCVLHTDLMLPRRFGSNHSLRQQIQSLKKFKKQILIKSQILTLHNLQSALRQGCFVLALIFEGSFTPSALSFDWMGQSRLASIQESFAQLQVFTSPNILIICGQNSKEISNLLSTKLSPKVIIEFDYTPLGDPDRLLDSYLQTVATSTFVGKFIESLIKGKQFRRAYSVATTDCQMAAIMASKDSVHESKQFVSRVGQFHMRVLEQPHEFQTKDGVVQVLDTVRTKLNIKYRDSNLLRSTDVLYQFLRLKESQKQCLNLVCKCKNLKQVYIEELLSFLWERNCFKNGVYLVDCKEYRGDLKAMLEDQMGIQISQLIRHNELTVDMLLIFDNFESLCYSNCSDPLFNFIFQQFVRNCVQLVFATKKFIDLHKTPPFHSLIFTYSSFQVPKPELAQTYLYLQRILLFCDGVVRWDQFVSICNKSGQLSSKVSQIKALADTKHSQRRKKNDKNLYLQDLIDNRVNSEQVEQIQAPPDLRINRAQTSAN